MYIVIINSDGDLSGGDAYAYVGTRWHHIRFQSRVAAEAALKQISKDKRTEAFLIVDRPEV